MDCRCRWSISSAQMQYGSIERWAGQLGFKVERRLTRMDMRHGLSCRFVCKPGGFPVNFHSCLSSCE